MRNKLCWRLGTAAALMVVVLAADTVQAQRRGRLRRGRSTQTYYSPWYEGATWSASPPVSAPLLAPAEADSPSVPDSGSVSFNVRLPAADAQLWMAGTLSSETGTSRTLVIPVLPVGQRYTYHFKATWSRDGRVVTDTREVACHAGDRLTVDFTLPNPQGTAVEIVPREVPESIPLPKKP